MILQNGYGSRRRNIQLSRWENSQEYRASDYTHRFTGHSNAHTDIKEANFIGERGEYVAAGSDDGNVFVWEKATGNIVRVLQGDDSIVNCVQWHPLGPMLATSGIANTVNLWEPKPASYRVRCRVSGTPLINHDHSVCIQDHPLHVIHISGKNFVLRIFILTSGLGRTHAMDSIYCVLTYLK